MNKKILLGLGFVMVVVISIALLVMNKSQGEKEVVMEEKSSPISLVASFYPLAFLAEEIGGENVDVMNVTGSRDVHEYRLSPKDITALHDADVVLYLGLGLEPWIEDMEKDFARKGIHAIEIVSFLDIEEGGQDQHADEDTHEDAHDDHGGVDPHVWLDPVLMQKMADAVTLELSAVDPDNAPIYNENAARLVQKLEDLNVSYASHLSACDRSEVIVSHDAFGRVADQYGFMMHPIAGLSTLDEPSAATLADLKVEAEEGITHILSEKGNTERFSETLFRETGLTVLSVNPLGRGPLAENKDYFDVMGENLEALSVALGCKGSE